MVSFPNCKINLGLNVINKREDGYHNIETVFLPVPLHDALEVIQLPGNGGTVNFTCSGLPVGGNVGENLCVKAYNLLKQHHPQLPAIKMHLHKAIPIGAGLGGGSADGAFALMILNGKFALGIQAGQLKEYALQLGSDCPFFIINKPCFAEKRGEELSEISLNLAGCSLLLVNPGIHIGTGWAFSHIKPGNPAKSVLNVVRQPIETWKHELVNDFEQPVVSHYPVLQQIKDGLYKTGAVYAGMSGSGSTFFGIFSRGIPAFKHIFPEQYWVRQVKL